MIMNEANMQDGVLLNFLFGKFENAFLNKLLSYEIHARWCFLNIIIVMISLKIHF